MKVARATRPAPDADDSAIAERLEEFFARYQAELLGTLYYLVGNADDARDALQDTFLKCWRHRASLPEIENLKAWVFRIALNTGRDLRGTAWRRHRVPLSGEQEMLASHEPPPEMQLEKNEQLARLREALHQLRPEEQEVFLLRQNGELTYEQIAAAIDLPLGTVKTRMRLALGKLRLALAPAT
jgi:RNA polymerase sigma-70 factor (ECF subfamily)